MPTAPATDQSPKASTLFCNKPDVEAHANSLGVPDEGSHIDVLGTTLGAAELRGTGADLLGEFGLGESLPLSLIGELEPNAENLGLFLECLADGWDRRVAGRDSCPMRFSSALVLLCQCSWCSLLSGSCCQPGLVAGHPGPSDLLVRFLNGCGGLGEAMQEDGSAILVKEVQDAIPGLANPEPGLAEFALDLRGIGIVERRPSRPEQLDPGKHLASDILRHGVEPSAHR